MERWNRRNERKATVELGQRDEKERNITWQVFVYRKDKPRDAGAEV